MSCIPYWTYGCICSMLKCKGRFAGGLIGLIVFIFLVTGLAVDDISGYSFEILDLQWEFRCGLFTFDFCHGIECQYNVPYGDYCHEDDSNDDIPNGNWCLQRDLGYIWFTLLLIVSIINVVAVVLLCARPFNKVQGCIRYLFLLNCLLCIAAAASWMGGSNDANLCWNPDASDLYLGFSLVLVMVAALCYFLAFIVTCRLKERKSSNPNGERLL